MVKRYMETGYIKYLTDDEFKQIKIYLNKRYSPALKMCVKVMMYLGLRVGEVVRLKRDNFSRDFSLLIYIQEKTHKPHERYVPKFLQEELQQYYIKYFRRMKERYLFFANYCNQSKNPHLQRGTIGCFFCEMRKKLGLKHIYYIRKDGNPLYRISPHTLRHYAIYRYYRASGNDLISTQQMIGHFKYKTTAKYINAIDGYIDQEKIIEKAFDIED